VIDRTEHGQTLVHRELDVGAARLSASSWTCTPLIAQLMIRRWISEVPSKIV
jgi:hypothetical protein